MTVAIFTPTRHPGIAVSAYSVARQTCKEDLVWLVADQIEERGSIFDGPDFENTYWYHEEIKEGRVGNLESVCNWALRWCRENDIELLVFLQDFIWMPPNGVEMFLADAKVHPFALLTGAVDASTEGWSVDDSTDLWSIFGGGMENAKPPEPYTLDTRIQMGFKPGKITQHGWEINYAALPHALINAGVDFDEDYDYGTQWGNTQFAHDIYRRFVNWSDGTFHWSDPTGYVWWNANNRAVSLPHRDYFPKTHEGERALDNGKLFWSKNPDLLGAK